MRSRLSALRSVATSVAKVLLPPKRPLGGAKPLPTPSKPAKPGRPAPATPDIEFAGITISYTPSRDGDADPGEVVWTWVPYEDDPSQGKDRPVVVVGTRGRRLVVVPLTSKRHDDEPQVSVGTGPWDRDGRESFAELERVLDLDPSKVRREGATLPRARFDAVVAGLRSLHGREGRH